LTERERWAEAHHQALRQWVKSLVKSRDFPRALEVARQAAQADPLREETARDLMRLYVAAGRPSAALQHYREMEGRLRKETGATPSPVTRRLAREIAERIAQRHEQIAPEEKMPPTSSPTTVTPAALPAGTVTFLLTDIANAR